MKKKILLVICALIAVGTGLFFKEKNSNLIPRQVIFGNPDKMAVSISPNGEYIGFVAPHNNVLNVWIAPKDNIENAKVITNDTTKGIREYAWAYDNKHIIYSLDNDGDENDRLFIQNIIDGSLKRITPEKDVKAMVVEMNYRHPNDIIIATNERTKNYFDLFKYNLLTSETTTIFSNEKFDNFIIDNDLNLSFVSLTNQDGGVEYSRYVNGELVPYVNFSLEDSTNSGILGFVEDNAIAISDSRDRDTAALKLTNLDTGEMTIIAEDSKSDVGIFTTHPTKGNIQAVVTEYEKIKVKILDQSIQPDLDYLQSLTADGEIIINSRSLDDNYWIVVIRGDDSPLNYYLYDRTAKSVKFLFTNMQKLEKFELAKMYPFIIKSRDDLDLVSYVSYPRAVKLDNNNFPKEKMPLVLFVHGGPWSRDGWGFDPRHQWLANRGYAVLSVNFRGSTGFGKNFTNAGNLQWGKKMHDDLIDAVNWAISNNIADANKICIMGGSYGGYATLVGMTFTPDVFACGVDIVGPSNLVTLMQNFPPYWLPFMNAARKQIGPWDSDEDKQVLLEISPISFVDKIKKPLLIAQGANDPRVNKIESDQIVDKMRHNNIPVLYALYPNEGHGFARPENRISFYAITEQFLAKILHGRFEPVGEDLKGASVDLNGKTPTSGNEVSEIVDSSLR